MKNNSILNGRVILYTALCLVLVVTAGCTSKAGHNESGSLLEAAVANLEQNNWDTALKGLREAAVETPDAADALSAKLLESLILISQADSSARVTEAYLAGVNSIPSDNKKKADALISQAENYYDASQKSLNSAKDAVDVVLKSFPGQNPKFEFTGYKIVIEDESSLIYEYLATHGETEKTGDIERAYNDDLNFAFAGSLIYAMGYNPEEISGTPKLSGAIDWPAYFHLMGIALSDHNCLKKVIELTEGDDFNPYRLDALQLSQS